MLRRDFTKKFIASLIVFMLVCTNFATLGFSLVSYAADESDAIHFDAQFVYISGSDQEESTNEESAESEETLLTIGQTFADYGSELGNVEENVEVSETSEDTEATVDEDVETDSENVADDEITEEIIEEDNDEVISEEVTIEESEEVSDVTSNDHEEQTLVDGYAIAITVGVNNSGYLKNTKIDIKDLERQIFSIRDDFSFGDYIQSIDNGKIKLKQIESGTEITVYIPITIKNEESVNISKLQEGTQISLNTTYVNNEGIEEVLTQKVNPTLSISNNVNLVAGSQIEKFIPYVKDGIEEALVQIRVTVGSDTINELPIKDTVTTVQIPGIEGADIVDVNVSAVSTGFTNGRSNGEVLFTVENWSYENGQVVISVNNAAQEDLYKKSIGNDEYIITYKYSNISDMNETVVNSTIEVRSNVFTIEGSSEVSTSVEKSYDFSQANSSIITYDLTRRANDISKGYLYANANTNDGDDLYEVEYDNILDVNISRVDLVNVVEIRESDEYFVTYDGNRYSADGNTYYKSVKINRDSLMAIIGEEGNLELLLEDGTSLITVDNSTLDEGDGYITIDFGENKIGKIVIRINNPVADGIVSILATKIISKTTYDKLDLTFVDKMGSDFIAAAALEGDIITELGVKSVETILSSTITNPTVQVSRNDMSTLVENEDVTFEIGLNNADVQSDMYKNPVFELVFPKEVTNVDINNVNLLYGNNELDIANIETLTNDEGRIVVRVTLAGTQTKYVMSDSNRGTTIIIETDISVNMYSASKKTSVDVYYSNEDATNYAIGAEWNMMGDQSEESLIGGQGIYNMSLNVVAPEGLVSAQMISNYRDESTLISINQGRKEDNIQTFKDARIAEMKMLVINNTNDDMDNVSILGRTIFNGNKSIEDGEALGANYDAPMVSMIEESEGIHVYYSENGEATKDLEDASNGWTNSVEDLSRVKSYLVVLDNRFNVGDILTLSYNFEIPANLSNNIDLVGTFATYYTVDNRESVEEADKVVLTTGDAPILNVETVSDTDINSVVEGQRIKYTVKISNDGRTTAENVVVTSIIPDGTTYVDEDGVLRDDVQELKIEVEKVAPGRTEEVSYEVEVDTDASEQTYIEVASSVEADGLEESIYTTMDAAPVKAAELDLEVESDSTSITSIIGEEIEFTGHITNLAGKSLTDVEITFELPDGLEYVDSYIEEFNDDRVTSYQGEKGVYNSSRNTIRLKVDQINIFKTFKVIAKVGDITEPEVRAISKFTVKAGNLDTEYTSNELVNKIASPQLDVNYYSTTNNRYVKEGERVQYVLEITNTGLVNANNIVLQNQLPSYLKANSFEVQKNNSSYTALVSSNLNTTVDLKVGESAKVVVNCVVQNLPGAVDEEVVNNQWSISGMNVLAGASDIVENIVQQNAELDTKTSSDSTREVSIASEDRIVPVTVVSNTSNDEKVEEAVTKQVYRVIGRAFKDTNKNGKRDDDEAGMEDVVVMLMNASNQTVASQTVTNAAGEYVFDNVEVGEYYVRFGYDSAKYQVSEYKKAGVTTDKNSDVIVSNYKAVTDKFEVVDKSISDIDIGLYDAGIFDLDLDASVTKMTVRDEKETKTYDMGNTKLAKVDIDPQYADSSTVYVEYEIDITNKGEISGYVKSIAGYLPEGFEIATNMDQSWYVGADNTAYTTETSDMLIQPGETKVVKLVLMKQMTSESTGVKSASFEINQTYNEYAISDIDSTEGNRVDGEDDISNVNVILGIRTGGSMINLMLITTTLITLLVVLYVIKLRIDNKNKEVIV